MSLSQKKPLSPRKRTALINGGVAILIISGLLYMGWTQFAKPLVEAAATGASAPHTSQPVTATQSAVAPSAAGIQTTVVRVVDGDTIVVRPVAGELEPTNDAGTQHTVRLLSIDSPEMNKGKSEPAECGAQSSTDHLTSLLPAETAVTISFDSRSDRTDRYGRSLAYVTLTNTGEDVQLAQVAGGYAEAWFPKGEPEPERFASYQEAAHAAEEAGAGVWGAPDSCSAVGR